MNRQKLFRKLFRFHEDIRENMCLHSERLHGHCVSVVNNYANTVSVYSTTTLTHMNLFYFGKGKKLTKKV